MGACGEIGQIEVERQLETEQFGDAARDIRITGKVTIDLKGKTISSDRDIEAAERGTAKEIVDDRRKVVRDEHLFPETPNDQVQALLDLQASCPARMENLRKQVDGAHNGTRNEMRKETHEQREIAQPFGGA